MRNLSILSAFILCSLTACQNPGLLHPLLSTIERDSLKGNYLVAIKQLNEALEVARKDGESQLQAEILTRRAELYLSLAQDSSVPRSNQHLQAAYEDFDRILNLPGIQNSQVALQAQFAMSHIQGLRLEESDREETLNQLLISIPQGSDGLQVAVHQELGWIVLDRFIASEGTELNEQARANYLEEALNHFKKALWADPDDEVSLLGLGICFYDLKDYKSAKDALQRSLQLTNERSWSNPVGHLYMALSLDKTKDAHSQILAHLDSALAEDTDKRIQKLYRYLLETLPLYYTHEDLSFSLAIDGILSQTTDQKSYWDRAHRLFDSYIDSLPPVPQALESEGHQRIKILKRQAYLGRAISKRYLGLIEGAISDLLQLVDEKEFPDDLERVFPFDSNDSAKLFGRLSCLFELDEFSKLESFIFNDLPALEDREGDPKYAYHLEEIVGLALLEIWNRHSRSPDEIDNENELKPEQLLDRARESLEVFISKNTHSVRARKGLAKIYEGLDLLGKAIDEYGWLTKEYSDDVTSFLNLINLHSKPDLPPELKRKVWAFLKLYKGDVLVVSSYIENWRMKLKREQSLYCRGCGRKTRSNETSCLYCGRSTTIVEKD